MLSNIFTFLPYQYAERMIDEQEKIWNYQFYQVPVKWVKIYKEDDGSISLEQTDDSYKDYFDLDPKIVEGARGMKVRIVTSQTASTMKALETENILKYMQAKWQIEQFKAMAMQTWWDVEQWDKISQRLDVLFNIDKHNIDITPNEEKLRQEMAEVTELLNSFTLSWNPDETANQIGMEQAMQQPPVNANWQETGEVVEAPSNPLWASV
jgi:hypothetical protein